MFLSVSTQALAVTSQRPSAMRALISGMSPGSKSSTILYTDAWDCMNVNSGYSSIMCSTDRKVDRAAATVSCMPHIQFMSICAWET